MRFQSWLWIGYFVVAIFSYFYLLRAYFRQRQSMMEKIVIGILALLWIVSVPVTAIIKVDDEGEEV